MASYNEQHKGKPHFHHQEPNPHWELDLESLLWEQASQKTFQVPEEYRAPTQPAPTLTLSCKVIRVLLQGWFCMPCAPAWDVTGVPPPLLAESELCRALFPARRRAFCAQAGTSLGTVGTVGRCSTCYTCLVSLSAEGSSLWAVSPSFPALPFSADKCSDV